MSQQPQQLKLPPGAAAFLRRAVSPGTLLGSTGAGVLLFLPSHSVATALGTSVLSFVVIGGLRAADPFLGPLWRVIGQVPWQARYVAGIALPILYSRTRFTASAAGQEIARARSALIISAVITYVLMRPKRGPEQGSR